MVPTLDGGPRFEACLAALERQSPRADELVVVDSASTDGTPERAAAAGAEVITIARERFDHGLTRNLGVDALSDVDVIVFLVQDAVPVGDTCLGVLAAAALQSGVAAATARQRPPADAGPLTAATVERSPMAAAEPRRTGPLRRSELVRLTPRDWRRRLLLDDVACAVRAPLFRTHGFPAATFGEDALLAYDLLWAGWALAHEPRAVVEHGHAYDPPGVAARYAEDAAFFREHFGLRVRSSWVSVLKGFVHECRADRRWLAAHPEAAAPGTAAVGRALRWAQVTAQHRASRGPLGRLPEPRAFPRPEELAA